MIDLSLKRIAQLVRPSALPWKAIHVAGTNGKGSICAYLSSILSASGIRVGRFTSPHLIDRWDCISIQNTPVSHHEFLAAEASVLATNNALNIGATEFELLTATAFEVFSRAGVEVGVVEVGLGGRDDATNVLAAENVVVTVLGKVDLDHQGFLGEGLRDIAEVKAGIAKKGVGMVVDGTNSAGVLETARNVVGKVGGGEVVVAVPEKNGEGGCVVSTPAFGRISFPRILPGAFQPHNLACAVTALSVARLRGVTAATVAAGVAATKWPGRLETVVMDGGFEVLVDGAHNPAAQKELRAFVNSQGTGRVWWVLAATRGKDVAGMVRELVADGDGVVATRFGAVDGMPWVCAVGTAEIAACVTPGTRVEVMEVQECVKAVRTACEMAKKQGGRLVVAGSLYLVGDLYRYLRSRKERGAIDRP